jgi:beta-N-acetylglucosaminidase
LFTQSHTYASSSFTFLNYIVKTDGKIYGQSASGTEYEIGTAPSSLYAYQNKKLTADLSTSHLFSEQTDLGSFPAIVTSQNLKTRAPEGKEYFSVSQGNLYLNFPSGNSYWSNLISKTIPSEAKEGMFYIRIKDQLKNNYYEYYGKDFAPVYVFTFDTPSTVVDLLSPSSFNANELDDLISKIGPADNTLSGWGSAYQKAESITGINALYLLSHSILESNWGKSKIAKDKKNLFGYHAYDSDPYKFASAFANFEDSILYVANQIKTNYLLPTGRYYNGANLKGMNVFYATDPFWSDQIGSIMNRFNEKKPTTTLITQPLAASVPLPVEMIKPTQNFKIRLLLTTPLYTKPNDKSKTYSNLAAQTIIFYEQQGDWYHIHTWMGDRWIKPAQVVVPDSGRLVLVGSTDLYNQPNTSVKAYSSISTQTLTFTERTTSGWYHIKTWLGDKWILPAKSYLEPLITPKIQTINLTESTTLYSLPYDGSTKIGFLDPQVASSYEFSNGWYHVSTTLGDQWIQPKNIYIGDVLKTNKQVINRVKKTGFKHPLDSEKSITSIEPQTLTVIAQWDKWYLVTTKLGNIWIDNLDVIDTDVNFAVTNKSSAVYANSDNTSPVKTLDLNTIFLIRGMQNNFFEVMFQDKSFGWISMNDATVVKQTK